MVGAELSEDDDESTSTTRKSYGSTTTIPALVRKQAIRPLPEFEIIFNILRFGTGWWHDPVLKVLLVLGHTTATNEQDI